MKSTSPPEIKQSLDKYLLDPLYGIYIQIKENLITLADKKIRKQDVGRRKVFDRLLKEYEEIYVRKKAEEADYNSKVKEAIEKMPCFPNVTKTMRFKRLETLTND